MAAAQLVECGVDLWCGKAAGDDGLPVELPLAGQQVQAHTHDVCAVLLLGQLVQGLKYCRDMRK